MTWTMILDSGTLAHVEAVASGGFFESAATRQISGGSASGVYLALGFGARAWGWGTGVL